MNESALYTIAEVGVALAGFSGLVIAFGRSDLTSWPAPDFMNFLFLITNSLLVVLFSLLLIPLLLWGLSESGIWGVCNLVMAGWFFGGVILVIRFALRHRTEFAERNRSSRFVLTQWVMLPVAVFMGITMLLSAADLLIPRGQAPYVLGLLVLLIFAGIQFAYFVIVGRRADAA